MQVYKKLCAMNVEPAYRVLALIYQAAIDQAQYGKGKERHAEGDKSFERQDICQEGRDLGIAYPIGQARKKAKEAMRLPPDRAFAELLGAINYLAGAAIVMAERIKAGE